MNLLRIKMSKVFFVTTIISFLLLAESLSAQTAIFLPDWLGVRTQQDVTIKNVSHDAEGKPKGEWRYTNNYQATNQHALFNYDTYVYTEFRVHKGKDYVEIEGMYNKAFEKSGLWKHYHNANQVSMTGNYTNDLKEGLWKHYDKKGNTTLEINYKNGKRNGPSKRIEIEGGNIFTLENNFIDDKEDGLMRVIVNPEDGEAYLYRDETYVNGLVVGEMKFYNSDKSITESFSYDGSSEEPFEKKVYHPNGQVYEILSITTSRRIKDGMNTIYYEDGKLNMKLFWVADKLMRVIAMLDAQGNELDHGTLKDGNGTFLIYDTEGNKKAQYTLLKGEFIDKLEF
ncbi:hypothetical protein [Lacinutrix sp. MEBiC02595]